MINEGRLQCKDFSGLDAPGMPRVDDEALEMCLQMGDGVKKGKLLLGVSTPDDLRRLARMIERCIRNSCGVHVMCTRSLIKL